MLRCLGVATHTRTGWIVEARGSLALKKAPARFLPKGRLQQRQWAKKVDWVPSRHKHSDMDFANVDIEEVGFDRPCTKDVHGSLGSLDIQLVAVR